MSITTIEPDVPLHLDAHVAAVNRGLQAVLDLLGDDPGDRPVQAASVRALLLPLADEARQAEPLARMLAEVAA